MKAAEAELPADAFLGYVARRGKTHFVRSTSTDNRTAYCGIWRPEGWLGTGNQDEYDEAARRRICDRCVRRAAWRFGT